MLWDTPGLGDGTEIDEHHKRVIQELLHETDEDDNALIDLVLVILDGSTRDLGTSYKILNEVIIPELEYETDRILVALNQADIAMKTGRHWDYDKNEPDETLLKYLHEKIETIKDRIYEDSGLEFSPIYYCAGYEEPDGDVVRPYNLSKLLYCILDKMPSEKRIAIMNGINTDSDNYEYNEDDMDYNEGVKDSFYSAFDFISDGVDAGMKLGASILGIPGAIVGVSRGLYEHYAIYLGNGRVIHYCDNNTDIGLNASVHEDSMDDFVKKSTKLFFVHFINEYAVKIYNSPGIQSVIYAQNRVSDHKVNYDLNSPEETIRRARSRMGEKHYNLVFNNCEHFVMWCKTGKAVSKQVINAATLLAILSSVLNHNMEL